MLENVFEDKANILLLTFPPLSRDMKGPSLIFKRGTIPARDFLENASIIFR